MISYLIRRILLMIPTLIGITIMVFLIARLAPGRPGQMQIGGQGVTAEEMKALQEWYDEKYGLDDALPVQYWNWWKSMFTRDVLAAAWYSQVDPIQAIYTPRTPEPEYYARVGDGKWVQLTDVTHAPDIFRQDDSDFLNQLSEESRDSLVPVEPGYEMPQNQIVTADLAAIESLSEVQDDLLKPATRLIEGTIEALAWTGVGEPLYLNPADPGRPLYERDGEWLILDPNLPPDRWTAMAIDDPQLQPILGGALDDLPQPDDRYALPRHVIAFGQRSPVEGEVDADALQRMTIETVASIPTRLWLRVPGDDFLHPVFEQADPIPAMLLQHDDGSWHRVIGDTRVELPPIEVVEMADEAFLHRLPNDALAALPDLEDLDYMPRQALVSGSLEPLAVQPTARDVRLYQHGTTVFEVTLGESIVTRQPVLRELIPRVKVTLMINIIAFPLIYLLAIPTGMLMAVKRGRMFDTSANTFLLGLWSIPTVLSATLFIGYLAVGGEGVEIFPNGGLSSVGAEGMPFIGYFDESGEWVPGWLTDRTWHLVLPIICIMYGGMAYLAKQMRAAMLDNFTMDYVRTARAKGVRGKDIVFRHVLRNSLLPIITIFATILPALIAGSIIIETIFNIEGMGLMIFRAVQNRDYDVVQALALIAGALNLTGLLLADICYALADPRITYS